MAMQLVWALKGATLEVLNQLPAAQRSSYSKVTAALERRYGYQHQTEVFRTRFRVRVRSPGETVTRLAQDLEVLVRRAYPEASEEMITVLLWDQFVDVIDNQQLRIYVQQAHPKDFQEALTRGLELESFLRMTQEQPSRNRGPHKVKARSVAKSPSSPSQPPPPRESFGVTASLAGRRATLGGTAHEVRVAVRLTARKQGPPSTSPVAITVARVTRRQSAPSFPPRIARRPRKTGRGWRKGLNASQRARDPSPPKLLRRGHPDHSDSGAERTFVQGGVLATEQLPVTQQQLCGITGHCTQLRGPVYARIEVGGMEERFPIYVADIGENLLGLDYLQRSRAVLDFRDMTMVVGGNVVPLQESGGDAVEREVSIETHRAHAAPSPEANHHCRLGEEQEEESLRPGECEAVQTTMDPEGHSEETQGSSTGVPPHLRELLQESSACLSREQVDELSSDEEVKEDPDLNPGQPEPRVLEEDEVEELCPLDGTQADVNAEPVVGRPRRE
ncbi:hypothetical protein E2C01_025375 [Portunus trituberculatus]|uniref:Retrotransposon gag domain-containing protein n=1 Tax=Portunus trituberculatus TaxID=210409 RepID=A0A5B7ED71_PORTR|nr:hypothetical protein [Portunus trituberculatus]